MAQDITPGARVASRAPLPIPLTDIEVMSAGVHLRPVLLALRKCGAATSDGAVLLLGRHLEIGETILVEQIRRKKVGP